MTSASKEYLIDGKATLGIWGCGYIGLTSMINFANEGIGCVGYDVDKKVVDSLINQYIPIPNLERWLGFDVKPLFGIMKFTTDWQDMLADDIKVHLIAVPTEKNGEPWDEPLRDVVVKIAKRKFSKGIPTLVIIESTLTPGMFEDIVIKTLGDRCDIMVGLAPRRDWFDSPEKNLRTLTRVVGGTNQESTDTIKDVLSIVCNHLIAVPDVHVVEMVKSVENSILHICATYACQLASAYPDIDVAEVLRLASTHWRIPLYYPSVGTGGYCIPVSSKYVKEGASHPEFLGITKETLRSDSNQPYYIADIMAQKTRGGSIGILGLSYKRDLRVHTLSPVLKIVEALKELKVSVKVFDPYYSNEDMQNICGVDSFTYPEGLSAFRGLIIVPPHRMFSQTPKNVLFNYLRKGQTILDNEGVWEKWRNDFIGKGINYHRVGDKGWCVV